MNINPNPITGIEFRIKSNFTNWYGFSGAVLSFGNLNNSSDCRYLVDSDMLPISGMRNVLIAAMNLRARIISARPFTVLKMAVWVSTYSPGESKPHGWTLIKDLPEIFNANHGQNLTISSLFLGTWKYNGKVVANKRFGEKTVDELVRMQTFVHFPAFISFGDTQILNVNDEIARLRR